MQAWQEGRSRPALSGELGSLATFTADVVLDETRLSPPVDLNGDGDTLDDAVSPSQARAVGLHLRLVWGAEQRSLEHTVLVRRQAGR